MLINIIKYYCYSQGSLKMAMSGLYPISWDNPEFKDWLAQYWTLYDPKSFIEELTQDQLEAGVPQDIVRYPTHEKGVMAVRMYNAAKAGTFRGSGAMVLAEYTFKEIFRIAGVTNEEYLEDIWEEALANGYEEQNSTTARW
jgi:hypothetical protein